MSRNTGLTAMQMRHAPRDALYVWGKTSPTRYAQDLARAVGRPDLIIIAADKLDYRLRGRVFGGLVIDHDLAGRLNANQREMLDQLRAYIRPKQETMYAT